MDHSILKEVTSLCPTCYKQIPATLYQKDSAVWMHKECDQHGEFESLVEPSAEFFRRLAALPHARPVERMRILNVTARCNMRCQFCYYPLDNVAPDPSIESLLREVKTIEDPVVCLSGGDPTVRDDLPELIAEMSKTHHVQILTNGVKLDDVELVQRLAKAGLVIDDVFDAQFSLHRSDYAGPRIYARKLAALDNLTRLGLRVFFLGILVERVEQIEQAISEVRAVAPHPANGICIMAPHKVWYQDPIKRPLFLSDMFREFCRATTAKGMKVEIAEQSENNTYRMTFVCDGKTILLCAWPGVENVILEELTPMGPFNRAESGQVTSCVHAGIINRGMGEGWLAGKRIEPVKSFVAGYGPEGTFG